ncbi:putative PEP-binding protein [Peptococcaceae bacterium 1198_IL3148]
MLFSNRGFDFRVQADIENVNEIENAIEKGAKGIGILRTESLYQDKEYNEEEQYQYYRQVFAQGGNNPITIRTFDGGSTVQPFGLWGIRNSIANPDTFQGQLRAVLRASEGYNVRIAIPGVADIEQFKWAKEQLHLVRKQLSEQGFTYNANTPLGIMVEIPSLVISLEMLTHEVNFYIVDADKLLKYLMALDTDGPMLTQLTDPMHPALLRAIKQIIDVKPENPLDVMVCGAITEYKQVLPIFKGIGIAGIAVRSDKISDTLKVIDKLDAENAARIAAKALVLSSADRIRTYVDSALDKLGI